MLRRASRTSWVVRPSTAHPSGVEGSLLSPLVSTLCRRGRRISVVFHPPSRVPPSRFASFLGLVPFMSPSGSPHYTSDPPSESLAPQQPSPPGRTATALISTPVNYNLEKYGSSKKE